MNDQEIFRRITSLVDEEHTLYQRSSEDGGLNPEEQTRMHQLEVALDQCWDLLRQRRARRAAGLDPENARVRDEAIVERYEQ